MPVFSHDYLHKVAFHIYRAEGVSDEEAEVVATHQVKANLVGHDSHGVIHIPEYVERIHRGHIVPGAPFEVVRESATSARVDGHWGFGFVVTENDVILLGTKDPDRLPLELDDLITAIRSVWSGQAPMCSLEPGSTLEDPYVCIVKGVPC